MKWYTYAFWIAGSVSLSCLATPTLTQAQPIEPDTTLTPNNSIVTPQPGNVFEIVGGVEAGSNLFHSFREFSLPNGSTAYFNNAASIQNVINRVTGGSVSNIDGLIRANGSANLFLLNPNGIIFGPNAQLNIGGSFLASTARSIVFADGNFFSATTPQTTPLLTISIPIGLEYRSNAGSIVNRSTPGLQVQPGKNLALVGGDVQFNGGVLTAPGGRVELGGLAESGMVGLRVDGNNLRLSFPDNVALADVSLTNQAKVEVVSFGGGNIAIDAQNLEILESKLLAGIEEGLGSVGTQAGDITINATGAVTVTDSRLVNNVGSQELDDAGNINIKAESLFIDDSRLEVNTFGKGDAGSIFIQVNDFVSLNGITTVQSNVEAKEAEGNGGDLDIQARALSLTDGAQLQVRTKGRGNAGNVTIAVRDAITIAGEDSEGFNSGILSIVREGAEGKGGTIDIQARSLSLTGGSQLSASVFRTQNGLPGGRGKGGDIIVNASDLVNVSGVGLDGFSSGIFASTQTGAVGPAGNITVYTNFFRIADGATVNVETENFDSGGNIRINANTFEAINGGQLITTANSSGNAGSITVNATDRVTLSGSDPTFADRRAQFGSTVVRNIGAGSGLFARSNSSDAGNVTINTPQLRVQEGAEVTVSSPQGQAGNLTINANSLSLNQGSITAETGKSEGEEGAKITFKISDLLRIENESLISATANGSADGGNIDIDTPSLIVFGCGSFQTTMNLSYNFCLRNRIL
ncbi:MAG: filamentous hemagglutinin N-terminal domain-containing protein [Xenococcaceae cyanobacterium MO_188.B32]|nr:filamentous hemagglutinin N-terminal domain-containing protein [Xenococcaceae cyanobacterium MO_188.B32]